MVTNAEIADVFDELSALTRIADGSAQSFRARAYESVGKTIRGLPEQVAALSGAELRGISGIGKSTASMIHEYVRTGRLGRLDSLRTEYPPAFQELVRVPGLGPQAGQDSPLSPGSGVGRGAPGGARGGGHPGAPGLRSEDRAEPVAGHRPAGLGRQGAADPDPGRHARSGAPGGGSATASGRRPGDLLRQPAEVPGHGGRPRPAGGHLRSRPVGRGPWCAGPGSAR